ncbi:mannosylglycoprotein endo-beta-mannosidase [Quercus suber]|uniref:Mannosylglycoprotein endo-beta-mannosidase n=1 Tax=Quercus suber TaxID=58331 RepID=A0AAW0KBC9_QUESU
MFNNKIFQKEAKESTGEEDREPQKQDYETDRTNVAVESGSLQQGMGEAHLIILRGSRWDSKVKSELPVKIIDPHLVSSFFDDYKRVYLHATTELENRRAWVAECSLNIQVTTGVEGNICLVGHLQTNTCHSLLDHMCNIHFLRKKVLSI